MKNKLFIALSLAVLATLTPASAQNTFKLATTLNSSAGVSSSASQVITTDVNGDGKMDLICASTVLTNNGKGVFSAVSLSPNITLRTSGLVVASVLGNGRIDLITLTNLATTPFTESIVVYTNSGQTGFNGGISLGFHSSTGNVGNETTNNSNQATGQGSLSSAGDVFGNGRANLFYLSSVSNSLSLFTNNGSGVFGFSTNFGVKLGLPAVADVNRDGKVDFITPSYSNNIVYVFTNGGGIYGSNASFKVRSPVYVVAADVNGDGWADLIVGSVTNVNNFYTNTISIWTNNGSGTFGSNTSFTVGSTGQRLMDIKAAQVFGDGQVDLVLAVSDLYNNQNNALMVYTNNGSGGFGSNTAVSVGSSTWPFSVAVADVSGDGALDLISANSYNGTLTIFTNTGSGLQTGSFLSNSMPVLATNISSLLAADFYRNGKLDLITILNPSQTVAPTNLLVLTNNGSGMFGSNAVINGFTGNGFVNGPPIYADIFGNGSPALIVPVSGTGNSVVLVVLTNNGSGVFGTNSFISTGIDRPLQVVAADVNGDGKLDLIASCYPSSGNQYNVIVLTNNGAGGFGTNVIITQNNYSHVAVADVNKDGRPDLILANNNYNYPYNCQLIIFTNISATGTGALYSASFPYNTTYSVAAAGALPSALIAADVNGDGNIDFIIANNNNPGTLSVMTNSGFNGVNNGNNSYSFGLNSSPSVGAYPHALTAADVNGDGKLDLISANWGVVTNTSDARGPLNYGTLTVLTNNGNGIFTNPATFSTGMGPTAVIATDVNDDGKVDLITANTTGFTNQNNQVSGQYWYGQGGNTLSILFNTSNFVNTVVLQTAPTDSPITYGQTVTNANLTGGAVTNESGVAVTGNFAFTTNSLPPAGTPNVLVTFTPSPPTDFQPITFNVSVTVSQLVAVLKGKRAYDGTTNAVFGILSVSNKLSSDNVTVNGGSVGLPTANVGTNAITSTNGLTLGGSTAANYTLAGMSGAVIITNAVNLPALASSLNPSGYGVGVSFTATLPAFAGGSVQFLTNGFLFDTQSLTAGSAGSVATTLLPIGSNVITAAYLGDANNLAAANSLGQTVTAPQINPPATAPGGLVMSGSFGLPFGTYYLLSTTNLSLPVNQWTSVFTNQFDASGNYSFTNPITPSPGVYFILEVLY